MVTAPPPKPQTLWQQEIRVQTKSDCATLGVSPMLAPGVGFRVGGRVSSRGEASRSY